jgi:hypothetical protein
MCGPLLLVQTHHGSVRPYASEQGIRNEELLSADLKGERPNL